MMTKWPPNFLTFVLSRGLMTACMAALVLAQDANAKPSEPAPDLPVEIETPEPSSPQDLERRESITISPPPPGPMASQSHEKAELFYHFRKALTFRAGLSYDTKQAGSVTHLGALLLFPYQLQRYEAGAELYNDGSGALHAARRFFYSRSAFRPYLKAGAGLRLVPQDQLVTLLRFENYQLRGAAGFEYLVSSPTSLRLELETIASTRTLQAGVSLGYVWAW